MANDRRHEIKRHILKAGLDLGLWTQDSGLWTLDSGLFPLKTLSPPEKTSLSPPKKLFPQKKFPPQIKNSTKSDFFPNKQVRSVRVFKQTTLFPPPTCPKKPLCLPLKTSPSQNFIPPRKESLSYLLSISRVQSPESRVQSPASSVQSPESRDQSSF